MLANRSIPGSPVIPVLVYPDVESAVDWLCRAFGFTVRLRIANHRAQLYAGDGAVMIREPRPEEGQTYVPGGAPVLQSVMVRVENVDFHSERATRHGARLFCQPASYPYGERQYEAVDFAGHHWIFSQTVADVDPAEWGGTLLIS